MHCETTQQPTPERNQVPMANKSSDPGITRQSPEHERSARPSNITTTRRRRRLSRKAKLRSMQIKRASTASRPMTAQTQDHEKRSLRPREYLDRISSSEALGQKSSKTGGRKPTPKTPASSYYESQVSREAMTEPSRGPAPKQSQPGYVLIINNCLPRTQTFRKVTANRFALRPRSSV